MEGLNIDSTLLDCVIRSTNEGLSMTGLAPSAIGASQFNNESRDLAVLVGLHGQRNGNMTISLSERTSIFLASRFLGEDYTEINEDVIDSVCELGNMVAGRVKDILGGTEYEFSSISLPALVFGGSYNFYHFKNIINVSVTFELAEISIVHMKDKFFTTSVALVGG